MDHFEGINFSELWTGIDACGFYLKPVVKVICRFQKEKNSLIVKFYDTPLDVDLQQDSSRKMTKIINNETHIKAIRSKMVSLGTDTGNQI